MIILLVFLAMLLIIMNFKAVLMDKSGFKQVLQDNLESDPQNRLEIIELRRELGETVAELQKEILEMKNLMEQRSQPISQEASGGAQVDSKTNEEAEGLEKHKPQDAEDTNDKVLYMLKQGMSIEDICGTLGMGKGEVLLIKNLYLRENS